MFLGLGTLTHVPYTSFSPRSGMSQSHWAPKTLFLTTTYLTPSPHPGPAPLLPLPQCDHATLPGWLPPAPLLSSQTPSPASPANVMKRLGLRAKRTEVGAQALTVWREKKQTAEESGARRGSERGCVRGGFPCALKGVVSISAFTWWRLSRSPVLWPGSQRAGGSSEATVVWGEEVMYGKAISDIHRLGVRTK